MSTTQVGIGIKQAILNNNKTAFVNERCAPPKSIPSYFHIIREEDFRKILATIKSMACDYLNAIRNLVGCGLMF